MCDSPLLPCKPAVLRFHAREQQRLFNAPEWSATFGVDCVLSLSGGREGLLMWMTAFAVDYYGALRGEPAATPSAYWITSVKVGLHRESRRWEVELWSRNLFNRQYAYAVFAVGDPRNAGVTLRIHL